MEDGTTCAGVNNGIPQKGKGEANNRRAFDSEHEFENKMKFE